jgi:Cd2+/Zn2+-exporting ATPase
MIPFMTTASTPLKLNITGMDCADCALTLEKGVANLPGVVSAHVNFAAATLELTGSAELASVTQRVRQLGYNVANPDLTHKPLVVSSPRGGIFALARFIFSRRETMLAVVAGGLALLAAPFDLWIKASWAGSVALSFHLVIVLLAGLPIARRGLRAFAFTRKVTIDLLMSIATVGALLIGETGEAATVIVLFAVGEALEVFTAERARDSLRSLLALRPEQATVLRVCMDCGEHIGRPIDLTPSPFPTWEGESSAPPPVGEGPGVGSAVYLSGPCPFCGTHELTLPVEEVSVGETVLIKPGERIPLDGRVLRGISAVNQAPVTGESVPVTKNPGEGVYAGSVNGEAALEIEVTQPAADSTISRIVRLVEQAQSQRAPVERFVDRFAAWYTPAVVAVAAGLAIIPPLFFNQPFFDTPDGHGWLYRALALLIVACPCALVISTPVTMVSALTGLARRGVLVKGGQFLDALARIRTFAFDKTGTLTRGQPVVRQVVCRDGFTSDELLAVAAAVERRSAHPLAQAIVIEADARGLSHAYAAAEDVQSLAGKGVQGVVDGCAVLVGSHTLLHEQNGNCAALHEQIHAAEAAGQTVMVVSRGEDVLGFVGVADVPRPTSAAALRQLKALSPHIRTIMLTGDNPAVAAKIAADLGAIDDVRASLLPEDKAAAVRALQTEFGPLAMVGDGVNDAPALATASVGIAMGGAGTAQAMETADLVLMQDNLSHLPEAVRASRRAMGIIRQNITFSLAIKVVFLALTLPGWATLWMAVFADMGASLIVTANGLRARR